MSGVGVAGPSGALGALVRLELSRTVRPFLLSLTPLAALVALRVALDGVDADALLLAAVGFPLMGAIAVPTQVSRDRSAGALRYLSSLPVSGGVLLGARVAALAVYVSVGVALALPFVIAGGLGMGAPAGLSAMASARVVLAAWAAFLCAGTILIGLLARFDMVRIFMGLFGLFIAGSVVQSLAFPDFDAAELLRSLGPRPLYLVGMLTPFALLCGAAAAGVLGARSLQPGGGPASHEARAAAGRPRARA